MVTVEQCREGACAQAATHEGGASLALHAAEGMDIFPGQTVLVPTGLKICAPAEAKMHIRPPTGHNWSMALHVQDAPCVAWSGFCGEIGVIMTNTFAPSGAQSVTQSDGQSATQPSVQSAVQSATQPATQPSVQPATQPSVQPVAQPSTQSAVQDGGMTLSELAGPPGSARIRGWELGGEGLPVQTLEVGLDVGGPCMFRVRPGDLIARLDLDPGSDASFTIVTHGPTTCKKQVVSGP